MKFIRGFLVVCFLMVLALFGVRNAPLVINAVRTSYHDSGSFSTIPGAVSEALVSDSTFLRYRLIDLSGLYYRATARESMNDVLLLNNGMLTDASIKDADMTKYSAAAKELSDWLDEQGIPFLYVQFPYKLDLEKTLLPFGYSNASPDNAMAMVSQLQASGVNTLDLYTPMGTTAEQISETFYVTDHHWRPSAAFRAFQATAAAIQEIFPEMPILGQPMLDETQWTKHSIPYQFLGSRGKRVGRLFGGVDDLEWITPNFETHISTYIPKHATFRSGTFEDAMIVQRYIDDPASIYLLNHYCVYIGGDYPLVHHRNPDAPIDMKVLIIKDSFALPYQAFMATLFTEVDVLDPRHYTLNSLPEYIQMSQPDLVLMPVNPSVINRDVYFFHEYPTSTLEPVETVTDMDIQILPKNGNYNHMSIAEDLQPDTAYRLQIGNIEITDGQTDGVTVLLYDFDQNVRIDAYCFDLQYGPGENGYEWIFRVPEGKNRNIQLLVYAGVSSQTNGIGIICDDVVLDMLE